jgi:hypothetical protein
VKAFLQKLVLWLPLAFLILALFDMFYIQEYFFKARYSVLQTSSLVGLTLSFLLAAISEATNRESKNGLRNIYKWHIAIPIIFVMVLLTLASMNR